MVTPPRSIASATIPSNESSQRAFSRKNRVYSFHSFLVQTYPNAKTVLDAAGGRGDLSFLLLNIDGIDSIIADPRVPNYTRLIKSIHFLVQNPDEANIRSVEGLATYQPLAKLMPLLTKRLLCTDVNTAHLNIDLSIPKNMRIHVDDVLIRAVRDAIAVHTGELILKDDLSSWDRYWADKEYRIASNNSYYGGTVPKRNYTNGYISKQIDDSRIALETLRTLDLIVGFHPDQATEAAIDLALYLRIPFAVVPCCVFPSEFLHRTHNGQIVKSYDEFIEYLFKKHGGIRKAELKFIGSDKAKSIVLYMLGEDFDNTMV